MWVLPQGWLFDFLVGFVVGVWGVGVGRGGGGSVGGGGVIFVVVEFAFVFDQGEVAEEFFLVGFAPASAVAALVRRRGFLCIRAWAPERELEEPVAVAG